MLVIKTIKKFYIFVLLIDNTIVMFEFDQYLGFLAFLTILTIGFWLMIFLISIIPYWIGGSLLERFKMRKAEKNKKKEIQFI